MMAWNTSSVIVSKKLAAWAAKLVRIYIYMKNAFLERAVVSDLHNERTCQDSVRQAQDEPNERTCQDRLRTSTRDAYKRENCFPRAGLA